MKPNAKINRTITINSTVQTTTTSSSNFHVMLFFYYSQNPKRIEFLLLITTTINVIGLFLFLYFSISIRCLQRLEISLVIWSIYRIHDDK